MWKSPERGDPFQNKYERMGRRKRRMSNSLLQIFTNVKIKMTLKLNGTEALKMREHVWRRHQVDGPRSEFQHATCF